MRPNKHAEPFKSNTEHPGSELKPSQNRSSGLEAGEHTDEEVEVLLPLCEQAGHRRHQVVVVVRLLVAADGLEELSRLLSPQSFLHIGQESCVDFILWIRTWLEEL